MNEGRDVMKRSVEMVLPVRCVQVKSKAFMKKISEGFKEKYGMGYKNILVGQNHAEMEGIRLNW